MKSKTEVKLISKLEFKLALVSFLEELCDKVLILNKERRKQNAAAMAVIMRKIREVIKLIDRLK